jgi:hypothetical protein
MPNQLVFPFGVTPAQSRADFIIAPCNEQALRFVERWPDWPTRAAAIWGPAQSGKSHLAEIWSVRVGGRRLFSADVTLDNVVGEDGSLALELTETHLKDVERDRLLLALFERTKGFLLSPRAHPSDWADHCGSQIALDRCCHFRSGRTMHSARLSEALDRQLDVGRRRGAKYHPSSRTNAPSPSPPSSPAPTSKPSPKNAPSPNA